MVRVGSLFSGIGGFDLGLERAGMTVRWQVENEPYCQKVLAKHWPDVPRYGDIKEIDPNDLEPVDLICGGFPCQPVSLAGKRLAQADERWLWPEFFRFVRILRPRFVLVENVPGLLSAGMSDVLGDLAASGYDAEWDCIPAAAVGAPHLRYRVWIVAYPGGGHGRPGRPGRPEYSGQGLQEQAHPHVSNAQIFTQRPGLCAGRSGRERGRRSGDSDSPHVSNPDCRLCHWGPDEQGRGQKGRAATCGNRWWPTESGICGVAHGVPARVERLRGLGNAVVPQVAEWIGRRIMEAQL